MAISFKEFELKQKELNNYLTQETERQLTTIELIASENFVSHKIQKITGSVLTNKYSEGYPGARYYSGCEFIDQSEKMAINEACKIFNCQFSNVQPYSGSIANFAVYLALVPQGGKVLGMDINSGGHLTHGTKVSFSGKFYQSFVYHVDPDNEQLDYQQIRQIALSCRPDLIICGASNYSRVIDFKAFREIADEVNAYLLADISHISGLVITGEHPSCFPYADVVTTTTHKTLRGPRGAIILWNNNKLTNLINKAVFPGLQGGPLQHVIAAKAQAFLEAQTTEYFQYIKDVKNNAKAMEKTCKELGIKIISGGTDNHLLTINTVETYQITGNYAEKWLHAANITTNKNCIPFEKNTPHAPSGIRLGSPAMTTRGLKEKHFKQIIIWIDQILKSKGDTKIIANIKTATFKMLQSL